MKQAILLLLILISLSQTQTCIADDLDYWLDFSHDTRALLYWPFFWYEKYENGEWVNVPFKSSGFPAIAYELEPGNPYIGYHFISIEMSLPGKYRICKDVWERNSDYPIIASSEFYYPGTILNVMTYLAFFLFLIRLRKN